MSQQPWGQQPGPAGGCFTCGGPHRKQGCPRRMSQRSAGKGGGKGKGKGKSKGNIVNPNANVQCHKCGRWGHKQVNCRVVADVEHPEQNSEGQEEEALIGGLGGAGDPWPLICGFTPSHSRRRRNRTPMLNGLGPIDVEMRPMDIPEPEGEIELEKEYVKMEEEDDEPEEEYVEPVEQFDLEKQGGGAAKNPRLAPPFTTNGRAGSKQNGGAVKTPRQAPPFISDGRAGSKQGGGAASIPRPRVGGEIHSAPGGHQGGEAAKIPGEREAWRLKTGTTLF